jgi:ABC-type branched-subunit amino acid transport system substrate-binding protein
MHVVRRGAPLLAAAVILAGCPAPEEPVEVPLEAEEERDDEVVADVGVTAAPCPEPVNEDNGCIYLGTITSQTGTVFEPIARPLTQAQAAFWERVNRDGGLEGFDVDVTTYLRDNADDPELHAQAYAQIREEVLALAQSFGSVPTAAILQALREDGMLAVPTTFTSAWAFEELLLPSGAPYCLDAMNAVDYAFDELDDIETVMAVHYPGHYGEDTAFGVRAATQANGAAFISVETPAGADRQIDAIEAVMAPDPELLVVTTGALEMGTIVGQAAARGFDGRVILSAPAWDAGLLDSPAADAFAALAWVSAPWLPWEADTRGHRAMRQALGDDVAPRQAHVQGWVSQYPLKAVLEAAVARGDVTRDGLRAALEDVGEVDYEGMLPPGAGGFAAAEPADRAFPQSVVLEVDPDAATGITARRGFAAGPTAEAFELSQPCFQQF